MKGTIAKCLEELVIEKFGTDKWAAVLEKSGLPKIKIFMTDEDVADESVMVVVKNAAEVLKISLTDAFEAFGEYWSTKYAPGIYGAYFEKVDNVRAFLMNLDHVHVAMTKRMKNARPPRFDYEEIGSDRLAMHYKSSRGLVALMPGLVRGVALYYKEKVEVQVTDNTVSITFLSAASRKAA